MKWKTLALAALVASLLAACGTTKVSTTRIEGVVTSMSGVPAPGVRVLVPGKSVVTTDADGRFVFEDVTTPYTLIVEQDVDKYTVYEGVTRTDPQLAITDDTGRFQATIEDDVNPTSAGNKLGLQLASRYAIASDILSAADASTAYSIEAGLLKPTAIVELYALTWSTDADGNAQDYLAYGRYASPLDLTTGATLTGRDITLTAITATHDLTVTTSGPVGRARTPSSPASVSPVRTRWPSRCPAMSTSPRRAPISRCAAPTSPPRRS